MVKVQSHAEEQFDILDESGRPTGATAPRSMVHRLGLWHRTVHIWVANARNELILQKRSSTKDSHPGMWDISAAGHVQAGDNPSTTALRELSEELGMKADAAELIHLGAVSHRHVDTSGTFRDNEFSEVFVLRRDVSLVKLSIQPEEVDEVAWCPAAMLRRRANRGDPSLVPHPEEYRILLAYLDQSN